MPEASRPTAGQPGSPQRPIVIAMGVYGDADRTAAEGAAMADCLRKINGLAYNVQVGANAVTSLEALGAGQAQIAFLDTPSIIQGETKFHIETGLVILRTYQDQLVPFSQREFIASRASGVRTLSDLRGKTICFSEPNSPLGTIVPKIVLGAHGINPDKDLRRGKFAGLPENIAFAVYKGECDAGTTYVEGRQRILNLILRQVWVCDDHLFAIMLRASYYVSVHQAIAQDSEKDVDPSKLSPLLQKENGNLRILESYRCGSEGRWLFRGRFCW